MKLQENISSEELRKQFFLLQNTNSSLQNENTYLKEQLAWFQKQIFGKKSEKEISNLNQEQLTFEGFENIEEVKEELKTIKAHTRRSSKDKITKISLPSDLPVKTVVLDISEEDKICKNTGKPLVKIGEEISLKLVQEPSSYYIKEIVRPKYALSNGEGIKIADMPSSIIPKCRVDESVLADIITKKYVDHLPLYRIAEDFSRHKIGISRQLLSQWVLKIGLALKPLYDELIKRILSSENVFIDESPIKMQDSPKLKMAFMWVMVGGKEQNPFYRAYSFKLNRNHEHARDLLKDYHGVVHSDKYGAYVQMANEKLFEWCPCWSHIRRKFIDSQTDPNFSNYMLRKIKYLFMLERIAWSRSKDERIRIRKEKEIPIINELISAVKNKLQNKYILPKSKLKEALGYFYSLVPYLKNYTKYPYAHLDNNPAERAVRPIAIGRKNWLFVGSQNAGEACSILLSLVQTCRALKINPRAYLNDILRKFMDHKFQNLFELLPDEWAKRKALNQ